jgi:hypothetical protein
LSKKNIVAGVFLLTILWLHWTASTKTVDAQNEARTVVVNLGTPHPISGQVTINGPIQHAAIVRIKDAVVSSVSRDDIASWTLAGEVDTTGFTSMNLSIQGQMRGIVSDGGLIGVILIPDEESIGQALSEGVVQLFLEATAPVSVGANHFDASAPWLPIAFPKYKVYLYNTTEHGASTNLFFYLTN